MLATMQTTPAGGGGGGGGDPTRYGVDSSARNIEMNAVSLLLAQLAFVHESGTASAQIVHHSNDVGDSSRNILNDVLFGGFSLSMDDEDWFFDAIQGDDIDSSKQHDNNIRCSKNISSSLSIMKLRGGFQKDSDDDDDEEEAFFQPSQTIDDDFFYQNLGPTDTMSTFDSDEMNPTDDVMNLVENDPNFQPPEPPKPPQELPERFLRAGKGDPIVGQQRYEDTLEWRKEIGMDTILTKPHPHFDVIKKHYPHYYHLRGRNGEPVFFEQPPKTNLQAMRDAGVTLQSLLRHYALITEFGWQVLERDDFARSITVIDLEGMRMRDFVGECVDYVKQCSTFTGAHYPERAGKVIVVNVPGWFSLIWKVVKPMVDEVTLKKISILRTKEEGLEALLENIPLENIPPEYGGKSMPLGESPEEIRLRDMMRHNNAVGCGDGSCGGKKAGCPFCSFVPARAY